jgi:hypothetical protein
MAYFREKNPNYSRPSIKESNRGLLLLLLSSWDIFNLNKDNKDNKEGPFTTKGNRIDLLEVKGNNLFIYSLTIPGFSLGKNR